MPRPGPARDGARAHARVRRRTPALRLPRRCAHRLQRHGALPVSFRPCAVVPCYNHGDTVGAVVDRLVAHGLEVIVVDDGSKSSTALALSALALRHPRMQVLRLERNCGKGAAVVTGLREAAARGFTHALQVDADGQHCLDDVPLFIEQGRSQPKALVCGLPLYDNDAPASRRYGRYITHFWVWIETRSLAIGDSMCG